METIDFQRVLKLVLRDFADGGIRYALMGGFAMGAYGIMRSTMDLDFLVHQDDVPAVDAIMRDHGYACVHSTENLSQYRNELDRFGQIVFLHAFRSMTVAMLDRARPRSVFEGRPQLPVLSPEDVIGLKLQALVNDPSREHGERADMQLIVSLFGCELDWELLKATRTGCLQHRTPDQGETDPDCLDRFIRFATQTNAFANHAHKPPRRMIDRDMRM